MDRIRQLEADIQTDRDVLASLTGQASMTNVERAKAAQIAEAISRAEAALKLERQQLEHDRTSAPAIDWPGAGVGKAARGFAEDEEAAQALPPLPGRTRAMLAKLAGSQAFEGDVHQHFAAVVRAAYGGDQFAPILAAGSNAVGSEGGFALRDDMAASIFVRAAEESVWMRIGARVEPMTSDTRRVVGLDDDDESGDAEAGLAAGWTAEGATATAQTLKLRAVTLHAKKLLVLAAASNELADDAVGYVQALEGALARAIGKKFDRAVLSGTGAGQPLGLLNAAATIEVSKTVNGDPGTSNTFTWNHAVGMWSRLSPGSHERAWWLMHPTVLPQALTMHVVIENVAGSENVGGFAPAAVFQAGGPTGYMLLGRPVVVTGRVKALSSRGDVLLVDPSQVAIGMRADITIDRSPHSYFTSDQLAVRGKFRGDALPLWDAPRTLQEGATTVSPYVVLQAR